METQTESILTVSSNVGASTITLEFQTYSVAEVAQVIGISEVTVYLLAEQWTNQMADPNFRLPPFLKCPY
jgi:hypothetical protein